MKTVTIQSEDQSAHRAKRFASTKERPAAPRREEGSVAEKNRVYQRGNRSKYTGAFDKLADVPRIDQTN